MKEIIIRIYSSEDKSIIEAIKERKKINFFDLFIDGEVYSNMEHLTLDIRAPQSGVNGELCVDDTSIFMGIEKQLS